MKTHCGAASLSVLAILLLGLATSNSLANNDPRRVRIGVDVQVGFESTLEAATKVADYLSEAVPDHRFVIVPLASHDDVVSALEENRVDFTVLNAALEVVASDRFGTVPLATMTKPARISELTGLSEDTCAGAVIRRADRDDIQTLQDIRGQRVSAVKPWSIAGWIAQWGLLVGEQIDPQHDLKEVVFEGTHLAVVESVLAGRSDVGMVDVGLLAAMILDNKVPEGSLHVINRQGRAEPLVLGRELAATKAYPNWGFAKTPATSDALARQVAEALWKIPIDADADPVNGSGWVPARNYASVRHLLQHLLGTQFAYSTGYPPPPVPSTWIRPMAVVGVAFLLMATTLVFARRRYRRIAETLRRQLGEVRGELAQSRAEKQRLDAILALAGCGIDIVDDDNDMVYADPTLTARYGDWHGRKCHEYYCGSETPCTACRRPCPSDDLPPYLVDVDRTSDSDEPEWTTDDPHTRVHCLEGKRTRMIGVPFHDESGRWLYARVHVPLAEVPAGAPLS